MKRSRVVTVSGAIALAASALAQQGAAPAPVVEIDRATLPVEVKDIEGVQQRLFRDGRVFIAGQPSEQAFERFKALGVTVVVNLRTQREMDNRQAVPFDEPATLAKLGLEYLHIPLGGDDNPWTPAAVERFAQALEKHRGPVLLHCTVAWRASYLWAAYLIRYGGLDLDAAMARGRAIGIGRDPLEGLTGRQLKVEWADATPAAAPSSAANTP
jgi:uncharacterized protein (TIGR01244 family)